MIDSILFFNKSNSPIIVFQYKSLDFFDCHLFYDAEYTQNINHRKINIMEVIVKQEKQVGITELKISEGLIDFSKLIDEINENLEDYNPKSKIKVFNDMIADMETKKINHIVTELLLIGRKLNISLV